MWCTTVGNNSHYAFGQYAENLHVSMELFPNTVQLKDRIVLCPADFEIDNLRKKLTQKFRPEVVENMLDQFLKHSVIGDKHPLHHRNLPELESAFPRCGFMFIFRDLSDVARSFQRRFEDPEDTWKLKGYISINYWCEAALNFLSYQDQHPEKCITVYFKHLFEGTFEDNMAQAHKLGDRLAQLLDVGILDIPSLEKIMKTSADRKIQNSWSEGNFTQDIFDRYARDCAHPIWTIDQYRDMHARLVNLDV
jgi:hypothetical protein